ncbi:MAG: cobalt ECF transporter T component CbiQ [Lachnospiraceae bacterium]|nr:cobalt ECF transporter T component CbiQ [Lachnospiraceae bacterium]
MPDLSTRVREIRAFDSLAAGKTVIHNLNPLTKILSTFVFIIIIASFGRYDFIRLAPYLFYPFVVMALAELPYKLLLSRILIVLPFCLLAGITNVIFERTTAFTVGSIAISFGVLSLATIMLKMYLCVMAALFLIATTKITDLTKELRRLHIPMIFVIILEMTFRYIGVLFEELYSMATAYKLRSGSKKGVNIKHIGSFLGQLLLRGFDRAERIHTAMRCRGYTLYQVAPRRRKISGLDIFTLVFVCFMSILFRVM